MPLSDDELLAGLKEAGHEEAATALEQKLNAASAARQGAGGGEGAEAAPAEQPAGEQPFGLARLRTAKRKEGYPDG